MATSALPRGAFPTMITPFKDDAKRSVDYETLDALIEWYIAAGCAGLFAMCLSSEMYNFTNEERLEVVRHISTKAAGRVSVLACGTFGGDVAEQAEFVKEMATLVDAVVVIVCNLAQPSEDDSVWKKNCERLLELTNDVPLGIYECPQPYHRLLSPELLQWCAGTKRFFFHKDTCCSAVAIDAKLDALSQLKMDTPFGFYNANVATLRHGLLKNTAGFSGISANFYPHLLTWLCANPDHPKSEHVQHLLAVMENVVMFKYPTSAKMYLKMCVGFDITSACRIGQPPLNEEERGKLHSLFYMAQGLCRELGVAYERVDKQS